MSPARRRSTAATAPGRAEVRGLRGSRIDYEVELDRRPVFDFLVTVLHDEDDLGELLPEDRRWLSEAKGAVPADLSRLLVGKSGKRDHPNLAAFAVERPELQDAASYVAAVADSSPADVTRSMAGYALDEHDLREVFDRAAGGDATALAEIAERAPESGLVEMLRDPARWVEELLTVLRYWQERYSEVEDRVRRSLERDLGDRAGDLRRLPPAEMVEQTTGGIRFLADTGVRRVILAPSYFARPFNYIFAANGWRLFCYPIADAALGGTDRVGPPPSAVRLYRALGDETRLRILRLLAERDHYLTELAQQLELSKPTVKHHLAQLRAAGLVTLTEEGSLTYWSLRRERVAEAGREAVDYLNR
jgi:DNA-binding transcriptional ArsR family regulator